MKNVARHSHREQEKQRSREKDRRELASGRVSVVALNSRNSHARGLKLDWARI